MKGIYTDLAAELRELDPDLKGISEKTENEDGIEIKRVGIVTKEAAGKIGKAIGNYVTIDFRTAEERPTGLYKTVENKLAKEIRRMLRFDIDSSTILVAGLGNRNVTPDSLGPRVVERIAVTRHISQYLPQAFDFPYCAVCAVAPGVLGITGVETSDIIKGIVQSARPDCIIAIDALASRRAARISSTIQLSDAGISPGSGIGNRRADLSDAVLGVPVIAIGVPLVVHASTIARDVISLMAKESGIEDGEDKLDQLTNKIVEQHLDNMFVTPKDIDIIADEMSTIIANAINSAIFGDKLGIIKEAIS